MTKLERFLESNNIKPSRLARAGAVSRKQLHTARVGSASPTLRFMRKVAAGVSSLVERPVGVEDLFEINPSATPTTAHHDATRKSNVRGSRSRKKAKKRIGEVGRR